MEWTVERITNKCKELSLTVGDNFDCPVHINTRLRKTLGRVILENYNEKWYPTKLEISKLLLETGLDEEIEDIIKHEWCHYWITKSTKEDHNHDKVFRALCAKVGCDGAPKAKHKLVTSKYEVYCPNCKQVIGGYSRMCKTLRQLPNCYCKRCGGNSLVLKQNW